MVAPQTMGAPPMVPGQPPRMTGPGQLGGAAPPPMVGAPQMMSPGALGGMQGPPMVMPGGGGVAAPPPMMSPGALGGMQAPPMVSPPGMFSPPSMVSPGGMPGGAVAQQPVINTAGPKVLVGFLVTFQNDPSGSFWAIHSGRTQLGRSGSEGVDIAIPDGSTSSRHATVQADPSTGQAFVEDDNSRNGTFLNEQKLVPGDRRQLRDNDRLRLGSTTFVVKLLVS
jgi:hypothetical protein